MFRQQRSDNLYKVSSISMSTHEEQQPANRPASEQVEVSTKHRRGLGVNRGDWPPEHNGGSPSVRPC